jgi:hypothetical protein
MFSHMYALVFGCLQPCFPLPERIRRLGESQNASSILVARSNALDINYLRGEQDVNKWLVSASAK